ncbi:MAG: ATP-binding cassette domain-containing protein [Clostridia bacterium]|nr:ATP-binding cassette domain-containing protein [Clostridia bacterium]
MNIIETKNLCYSYDDGKEALNSVSISFEKGITTAVLGGNGAGKSTLFLTLNGILNPTSGEVFYNGEKVQYKKAYINELRKKIGIVFQNPDDQLFSASVYQDISFGATNLKLPKDEIISRVDEAMKKVGILHLRDKPTHALSFGQKKRVAVAGILVMRPEVIILDEPTAGLDPMGVSELMHLLEKICKEDGVTVILSTHDIDGISNYANYIYVMNDGEVLTHGTPHQVFSDVELLRSNNLRLPRISHLLEILSKEDGAEVDFSASTISAARRELLKLLKNR